MHVGVCDPTRDSCVARPTYAEARLAAPESTRGMQAPRDPHVTLSTGGTRGGAGGVGTGGRGGARRGRAREPRAPRARAARQRPARPPGRRAPARATRRGYMSAVVIVCVDGTDGPAANTMLIK